MSNTAVLKIVLIFCFLLEMQLCFSQPHVTMSLQNCAAVTHKILAFDLYIMNDDTVNSTQLAALAFGINYDSLILNGGAPASSTFAFQPGTEDSTLTLLANNYLTLHELSFHHLKLNTQTLNHTNAPVLIPKMQYKVGRFTFTNSGVWAANSSPAFAMQLMAQTNHTLCIALIYINGNPSQTMNDSTERTAIVSCNLILNGTCTIPSTPVNAGIGQLLTITGHGFGNTRGIGNVFFKNADNPIGNEVGLDDPFEWTNPGFPPAIWTDTLIKVVMPSVVTDTIPPYRQSTPGSGLVKVTNNSGSVFTSTDSLNIDYAIRAIGNNKNPARLCRFFCNNGYTFYLGNTIGINSPEKLAIEAACNAWSDKLNIDVKLSTVLQPPLSNRDSISVIYITTATNSLDSGVNMLTQPYGITCGNSFIVESDIAIKPNPVGGWHTDPGNTLPQGKKDFYATILHEIGHALGLMHSIDLVNYEKELMYYGTSYGSSGGTLFANRTSLTSGGGQSADGEFTQVIVPSRLIDVSSCSNFNTLSANVISSPTISYSDTATCMYHPVALSSSTTNFSGPGYTVSNLWSTGATTQSITVTAAGTYSLTVSQNNCSSVTTLTIKSLNPSTIITQTQPLEIFSCESGTATFTVAAAAGSTYQWQRSPDNVYWFEVNNDYVYWSGSGSPHLNILFATDHFLPLQYYRCMVTNGPGYCPQPGDVAILHVEKTHIPAFAIAYAGGNAIHLTTGTPAGGTYSGDSVVCVDPPNCPVYIYTPPPVTPVLSTPVNSIHYAVNGCLPQEVTQQVQIIYCPSTPPCDAIITGLKESLCIKIGTSMDLPYIASGTFNAGNEFKAYLSDVSGNFTGTLNEIGKLNDTSLSGNISCYIPYGTSLSANYRIRVDAYDNVNNITTVTGDPCPYDITITKDCNQQRSALVIEEVYLYPNPSSGTVHVVFTGAHETKEVTLLDVQGRVCLKKYFNREENNGSLVVSKLKAGLYIARIKTGDLLMSKKLIIAEN